MFDCIYLAAGVGARSGLSYPKQFLLLRGKPIMIYALEIFQDMSEIDKIIIPRRDNRVDEYIKQYNITKALCVDGGETRQESVKKALEHCTSDRVVIHEAVRPFITKEHIMDLISYDELAVVPYVNVSHTVAYLEPVSYPARHLVANIQLPQVYRTDILRKAHDLDINTTDDSSLVYAAGVTPLFIKGLEYNIKITTPLDVRCAEVLYDEYCRNNRS